MIPQLGEESRQMSEELSEPASPIRHNLRVVATAACVGASIVLVALSIRSARTEDRVTGNLGRHGGFRFYSSHGCLVSCLNTEQGAAAKYPWGVAMSEEYWIDPEDPRIVMIPRLSIASGYSFLSLPYWTLFVGAIGAAVFIQTGCQFSLRTLLIGMTCVAIVLGILIGAG